MDALITELIRQGTLGIICAILLVWIGVILKQRDEEKKESKVKDEAQIARYEALMSRNMTVMESTAVAIQALTGKIENMAGTERLLNEISGLKDELRVSKSSDSRR